MSQKHTAESILDMSRGFMPCRLLLTGAELDIFTMVGSTPLTAEEATEKLNGSLRGMTILLDALAALGFLIKKDGRYETEPSIAPLLSSRGSESVLPMIRHAAHIWRSWSRLTEIARNEYVQDKEEEPKMDRGDMEAFIGAMHVIAARSAPEVVAALNPGEARSLIDVGGGSGTYTLAFLKACPEMKASLFDRPPVIEMARKRVKEAEMMDRVTLIPGDYRKDDLPTGHDLGFVSAVIHQNSHEENLDLYKKIFRALDSGGRIVIRDHVMAPDRTRPVGGALFAVNMLVNTPGGRTWTYEEIEQGLADAGFTEVKQIQTKGMFSLVEAFKP